MEKLYTQDDYFNMACEANAQGKLLIKVPEEITYEEEVLEWEKKTITVDDYDPETGEIIGHHTEIVDDYTRPIMIDEVDPETGEIHKVQKHHTETRTKWVEYLQIVDNPDNTNILKAQLEKIDKKSVRSLRAIAANAATTADREFIASLEEQAEEIRSQLEAGQVGT